MSMTMSATWVAEPKPLTKRPLDIGLIVFFGLSILYGLTNSLPQALGVPIAPDSPWPPLQNLYQWAINQEPSLLQPSIALMNNAFFDGFVQSPLLFAVCYGLWTQRTWVVPLGLFYAGASVLNMCFYFSYTYQTHTPPNLGVYLPMNLPWLIAPALLAMRLWNGKV
jgi:hypothetical protein